MYPSNNGIYNSSFITVEDGITTHRNNERAKAWNCFNYHADRGSMLSKYLKGYYLWEGYGSYNTIK